MPLAYSMTIYYTWQKKGYIERAGIVKKMKEVIHDLDLG